MNAIIQDAISLSSGTIATLTGSRDLEEINGIQNAFVQFLQRTTLSFSSWMIAWEVFQGTPAYCQITASCIFCN